MDLQFSVTCRFLLLTQFSASKVFVINNNEIIWAQEESTSFNLKFFFPFLCTESSVFFVNLSFQRRGAKHEAC